MLGNTIVRRCPELNCFRGNPWQAESMLYFASRLVSTTKLKKTKPVVATSKLLPCTPLAPALEEFSRISQDRLLLFWIFIYIAFDFGFAYLYLQDGTVTKSTHERNVRTLKCSRIRFPPKPRYEPFSAIYGGRPPNNEAKYIT